MALDLSVSYRAPETARAMSQAASQFVASSNGEQRAAATFPFAGDERYAWGYRPRLRNGLRRMAMTREQRQLALALVDAGMSTRGAAQARWSIALDDTLREHERADGHVIESRSWRDSESYWFSKRPQACR